MICPSFVDLSFMKSRLTHYLSIVRCMSPVNPSWTLDNVCSPPFPLHIYVCSHGASLIFFLSFFPFPLCRRCDFIFLLAFRIHSLALGSPSRSFILSFLPFYNNKSHGFVDSYKLLLLFFDFFIFDVDQFYTFLQNEDSCS